MRTSVVKNGLVMVVILLFIGVAVQPSVATVQNEDTNNDFEEIIFQTCESDSITNHTLMITKQQLRTLDELIDDFKMKLDDVDTYEETVIIYKDMIKSLDKIDLLPNDLIADKAEELVFNGNKGLFDKDLKPLIKKGSDNGNLSNMYCLLSGDTTNSAIFGPSMIGGLLSAGFAAIIFLFIAGVFFQLSESLGIKLIESIYTNIIEPFLFWFIAPIIGISLLFSIFSVFNPLKFLNVIGYGVTYGCLDEGIVNVPSKGWINTYGQLGKKTCHGKFYGQYSGFPFFPPLLGWYYTGTIGFTGINIIRPTGSGEGFGCFSMGTAISVKIDEKKP